DFGNGPRPFGGKRHARGADGFGQTLRPLVRSASAADGKWLSLQPYNKREQRRSTAHGRGSFGERRMILVITGQQRSGTTMLRYFCNSHPEIAVTHEFGTFLEVGRPYAAYAEAVRKYNQTVDGGWGYVRTYPARWQTRWHNRYFTWRYLALLRQACQTEAGMVSFTAVEQTLQRLFKGARVVGD